MTTMKSIKLARALRSSVTKSNRNSPYYLLVTDTKLNFECLYSKPSASYWNPLKSIRSSQAASDKEPEDSKEILHERSEAQIIFDYDDKFGLSEINDPKKIFTYLKNANYDYSVRDLIYFFRRLIQIKEKQHLIIDGHHYKELETLISTVKSKLKATEQGRPYIGSLAHCLWKLGYKKDQELWKLLGRHVIEGRYYTEFREGVYGIEGFQWLRTFADQEFVDEVYKSLERVTMITIWEVNMTYYQRIANALVGAGRSSPKLFQKLEYHILRNLDMEYELKTMLDILFSFAKSGNGSKEFYRDMQFIIFKGHMFNRPLGLQMIWVEAPTDAMFVGKLCEVYKRACRMHSELLIDPNFANLAYNLITSKKASYELESLVQVLENVDVFEFEDNKELNRVLQQKLFTIDTKMDPYDMVRYLDVLALGSLGGDYSKIPQEVLGFFENYLVKNMMEQDPRSLYYFVFDLEARKVLHLFDMSKFMGGLAEYVSTKLSSYDFDDMCYYLWLFSKYNNLIDSENPLIQHHVHNIENNIKLIASFSEGRPQLTSNYYKMLEVLPDKGSLPV